MAATITPSEFVRPGNVVMVVKFDSVGPSAWVRREVAKVNAQHFTVEGVTMPGEDTKPVRFRNKAGTGPGALPRDTVAHEAAAEHVSWYVIEDATEATQAVRDILTERVAVTRVKRATRAWNEIENTRTSTTHYDRRPTPAAVDEALVELAAAAVELRGVLGVPEPAADAVAAS